MKPIGIGCLWRSYMELHPLVKTHRRTPTLFRKPSGRLPETKAVGAAAGKTSTDPTWHEIQVKSSAPNAQCSGHAETPVGWWWHTVVHCTLYTVPPTPSLERSPQITLQAPP